MCAQMARCRKGRCAKLFGNIRNRADDRHRGKPTASGERFNTYAMTAAHKTRRFGSHVTVTNLVNGRFTTVRINDRGPFVRGRCIDLSRAAADAIGMGGTARAPVQ
jgi:rare lipoprotein A